MSVDNQEPCCPHCGGATGFTYTMAIKSFRLSTWDKSQDEEIDMRAGKNSASAMCQDCGKRVKNPMND